MVSPQTVFTYPFHHAKLQSYYMVSPQTVFTYPFHHAKLQVLLHGVTAKSLYLSFSPCKVNDRPNFCGVLSKQGPFKKEIWNEHIAKYYKLTTCFRLRYSIFPLQTSRSVTLSSWALGLRNDPMYRIGRDSLSWLFTFNWYLNRNKFGQCKTNTNEQQ